MAVREAIRAGIQATNEPPEGKPTRAFRPHVSVAYVNADAQAGPVQAALDAVDVPPVRVSISHVTLIEMHRDNRMYQWRTITTVPLGDR